MLDIALNWLGVGADYLIATALIVGGAYLALYTVGPLRFVGICLFAFGVAVAAYTFGRAGGLKDGGAAVEAEWKAKNYEAQLALLRQEAAAKNEAAEASAQLLQSLATDNIETQRKIDDAKVAVRDLPACRRSTDDDDKRMCDITGNAAPGCQDSK